jgi:hypothetical protein
VLNFAHGRETLVNYGTDKDVKVPGDSIQEVRMAPKIAGVAVKVLAADGSPPAQTSAEVDFSKASSAYVVVGPDYRGRMRPRVIDGGLPPVIEAAPPVDPKSLVAENEGNQQRRVARMDMEHELGQILIQMNQPGQEGNRAKLEAKKQELERKLKQAQSGGSQAAPPPASAPAPATAPAVPQS